MEPGVNLAEPAQLDAGVYLRGCDRGMAEHLLNGAKVGPAREQVRGEAVAQGVRADCSGKSGRENWIPPKDQTALTGASEGH